MDFLSNYMRLSREERTKHIDLSTPCDLSQSRNTRRKLVRQLLLIKHELVDDVLDNQEGSHVNVCHCCSENSSGGYCANPDHSYLGTHAENQADKSPEARQAGGKASPGRNFTSEECARGGRKGGVTTGKKYGVCIVDGYIGKLPGLPARVKKSLGIDRYDHFSNSRDYIIEISKDDYASLLSLTPLQRLLALGMK